MCFHKLQRPLCTAVESVLSAQATVPSLSPPDEQSTNQEAVSPGKVMLIHVSLMYGVLEGCSALSEEYK